ncbi:MAG: hypothetical protein A2Y51_07165 [Gallionellales bacterium RIFCSPLOWO2_02_60_31]|nr:MAG: hypothetical protein A2Y51_07165 [Gallionellales bacterium RIFCSPLOWO2_02_60_31]
MSLPGLTDWLICTRLSGFASVSSTRITASAPSGIGAPVMMRAHWPDASALIGISPALISSMISSIAGILPKSALRNA